MERGTFRRCKAYIAVHQRNFQSWSHFDSTKFKFDLAPCVGYCDADWADCKATRRSTTGHVFYCFGAPVAWKCRHQPTVALSTTEGEYMASADGACQAVWLQRLVKDQGHPQQPFPFLMKTRNVLLHWPRIPSSMLKGSTWTLSATNDAN